MYIDILLPGVLALYALARKKLTLGGIILAWILGFIICHYGGYIPFAALSMVILLTLISDKMKKGTKDKTRTFMQIISNMLTATISIIIYTVTQKNIFYVIFYAVMAASLSDTLASSIGSLSKKPPVNMFTMQKLKRGESGAVSLLGLFASLLGGIIIGAVYLFYEINISNFVLIAIMGLLGSIMDSIMGTIFQAKYRCQVCHETVETKRHCQKKTELLAGYKIINNDIVNFLSNILIFIISYILLS